MYCISTILFSSCLLLFSVQISMSHLYPNDSVEGFEVNLKDYISKNAPSLHIMTPCLSTECPIQYTMSLIQTIDICRRFQVPVTATFETNEATKCQAKNRMIAKAMANKETTHFLLVDSNIQWNPLDVLKLLVGNKPFLVGICPKGRYQWKRLTETPERLNVILQKSTQHEILKPIPDVIMLQSNLMDYNVSFMGTHLSIQNNMVEVDTISSQFLMLKREVFEKMSVAFPSSKYSVREYNETENEYLYAYFNTTVEEGRFYDEDMVFGKKWKNMDGEIFADLSIQLSVVQKEVFAGHCISAIL